MSWRLQNVSVMLCFCFCVLLKLLWSWPYITLNSIPIIWNDLSQFVNKNQRMVHGQGAPTQNLEPLFSSLMLAGFHNHSWNYGQNDNQHVPPFPQSELYTLVHCITIAHQQCWWLCYKLTSKGHCPHYVKWYVLFMSWLILFIHNSAANYVRQVDEFRIW